MSDWLINNNCTTKINGGWVTGLCRGLHYWQLPVVPIWNNTPGLPPTQKETKTGTHHTIGGEITQRGRRGTAALGFSSQEQVNVEEGFSPSPYSGKIF